MLKVLIVEDERLIAMDLKFTIQKWGFTDVNITDNGKDAINLAKSKDFDLIIMDINILGDIDGIEVARTIQKYKKIPIIFCSAYTDKETLNNITDIYSLGFLEKPFADEDLLEIIEKFSYKKPFISAS